MIHSLDSAEGAAEFAASLLASTGDRWARTQAVAARARELRWTVADEERELLVAAGWLQGLSGATEVRRSAVHPGDLARYLEDHGASERLVRLIRLVTRRRSAVDTQRYPGETSGPASVPQPQPQPVLRAGEDAPLLDALLFADAVTGPAGQAVDFAAGEVPAAMHRTGTAPHLAEVMERVWRRFAVYASLRPSQRTMIDESGWWPPTLFAAEHLDADLMAHLLDAGAAPDEGTTATPLTHTIDSEGDATLQSGAPLSVTTTAVLLAYGADPELPDGNGTTPLMVAERYDHTLAINLLRRHIS